MITERLRINFCINFTIGLQKNSVPSANIDELDIFIAMAISVPALQSGLHRTKSKIYLPLIIWLITPIFLSNETYIQTALKIEAKIFYSISPVKPKKSDGFPEATQSKFSDILRV